VAHTQGLISQEKRFNSELSGNEVHYTACSLLVISKNSCGKLHCQIDFNQILVSYKILSCKTFDLPLQGGELAFASREMAHTPDLV
jgi:hypothetical protein